MELREAERLFRRALEIDRTHHEARIRHGRTLTRLASYDEAARELRTALDVVEEPVLRYYGALFLGAAEEGLGRFDQARAAYQQALSVAPRAAAPRLALSQLDYRTGERGAAQQRLDEVLAEPRELVDDEWWTYRKSSGRNADDLIDALYRPLNAGEVAWRPPHEPAAFAPRAVKCAVSLPASPQSSPPQSAWSLNRPPSRHVSKRSVSTCWSGTTASPCAA